jgi:hypothetical protein
MGRLPYKRVICLWIEQNPISTLDVVFLKVSIDLYLSYSNNSKWDCFLSLLKAMPISLKDDAF